MHLERASIQGHKSSQIGLKPINIKSLFGHKLVSDDEHIIRCSECGRNLIVKDTVNNGVAFLSHLRIDHGITYTAQRLTSAKGNKKNSYGQYFVDVEDNSHC